MRNANHFQYDIIGLTCLTLEKAKVPKDVQYISWCINVISVPTFKITRRDRGKDYDVRVIRVLQKGTRGLELGL